LEGESRAGSLGFEPHAKKEWKFETISTSIDLCGKRMFTKVITKTKGQSKTHTGKMKGRHTGYNYTALKTGARGEHQEKIHIVRK